MTMDMTSVLDSMENAIRLRSQAETERRAEEAERERREFQEKLMRAAVSEVELDGMASKLKGKEDAVRRDQLIGMMMAGF